MSLLLAWERIISRRLVILTAAVILLLLLTGCASTSAVTTAPKTGTDQAENKILSKDKATNILSEGTYFFDQRINYTPDSEAIQDAYELMDSNGIFPCYRKAQETSPFTNNEPNGEFWWCQATEGGLKQLSQIPFPPNVPPKGQQISYISRLGNQLLFIISGAYDETAESNWQLAFFDGQTTRTVVSSKDYTGKPIKMAAEPWHIGLCDGKAYWATFDMLQADNRPKNSAYIYTTPVNSKSSPQIIAKNVTSFKLSKQCDLAIYYQQDTAKNSRTSPKIDLFHGKSKIESIILHSNISNLYGFAHDYFIYRSTETSSQNDLIIENLLNHHKITFRDTPCKNIPNINEVGTSYFYFTCADSNYSSVDTFLYDLNSNNYYIVPDSYAGFASTNSEKCMNTSDCFLVSWSKTDYVIPIAEHRKNKLFSITQSYAYWSPDLHNRL